MKWRKEEGSTYPERWVSDCGRFEITRTSSRWNIRPRPVTVTKVTLVDRSTAERWQGARILRDAKERAAQIVGEES